MFNESIEKFTTSTKGHAEEFNKRLDKLIENDKCLNSQISTVSANVSTVQNTVNSAKKRADEAFQFANDGKKAVANAVTAKGVSASPTDTFSVLANKIGQISTGKRWVRGSLEKTQNIRDGQEVGRVTGLAFVPSYIIIAWKDVASQFWFRNGFTSFDGGRQYRQIKDLCMEDRATFGDLLIYINENGFYYKADFTNKSKGGSTMNIADIFYIAIE
ncbi:hypothetical protein [Clostridium lundense]|uniref:hypothetical protein n=1 Tax=Clostridium lundense TaxID=319475 RepID=UPI0004889744|nr:hypothetical protein [Clostridium lundense]